MKLLKTISSLLVCASLLSLTPLYAEESTPVYDGSGMTIAILDRGFDLSHDTFIITDTEVRLTKEASDALIASTSLVPSEIAVPSAYVSPKVPFAYDYGDNDTDVSSVLYNASGTNLLSVAAGNGKLVEEYVKGAAGIAPEAQILAMKVHSDKLGDVSADAMIAAINDSVILGADVILIGIVSMKGFDSAEKMSAVNAAIKNAEENGVIVVTSSGSNLKYGSGSVYEEAYGSRLINADSPDIGTIAWPGYLKTTFTVSSAVDNTVVSDFFTHTNTTKIPYGDTNYMYPTTTGGVSFDKFFDGKTLEYVFVKGYGTYEDFEAAGDIKDKIALVERGEIPFAEKAQNAAEFGAIGLIVIDNQPDDDLAPSMRMDLTDAPIPTVIISSANGSVLKSAEDKRITVKDGETYTTYTRDTPSIADNSAYGSTTELSLKPDITAVGNNVECATVNNGYTFVSSARIAAARVAGMCACVKGRFVEKYPKLSRRELASLTRAAIVSSAGQMKHVSGRYYSPRIQGGGAANLESALGNTILLTSNGSHKIEIGECNSQIIKLRVTAHNLSDTPKVCTLDAIVGSDGYDMMTFADLGLSESGEPLYEAFGYEKDSPVSFTANFAEFKDTKVMLGDVMYQLNCASENYDPCTFTLAPGASNSFTVTLYIDDETYKNYRENFTNGFFIEGFVRLTSEDEAATIPYLGFVGDYGASPSLDADIYGGEQHIYDPIYLYRHYTNKEDALTKAILGESKTDSDTAYRADSLAFSPIYDRKNAQLKLNLGLRRSIRGVSINVFDSDGNVIYEHNIGELMRTYMSATTGSLTSPQILIWDGRASDNPSYIYPDGKYTVSISYRTAASDILHTFAYEIHLDTKAPTLDSYEFFSGNEMSLIKLSVTDDFALAQTSIMDSEGIFAKDQANGLWDISNLHGQYLYIEITDLAMNTTIERVANPNYSPEI